MMLAVQLIAVVVIAYLIGSIPFGVLIARRKAKIDLRGWGSGKIGATNVLRTMGRKAAITVALLDMSKGLLAVIIAGLIFSTEYVLVDGFKVWWLLPGAQALAALAAVAGHIWPVFLGFRGGRGVATFFGGLIALSPAAAIFGGEVLILGAGLTRFMSLGSIAGAVGTYAILVPLTLFNGFPIEYLLYSLLGVVIVIFMHRDNIVRLLNGKERRLGEKVAAMPKSESPGPKGQG